MKINKLYASVLGVVTLSVVSFGSSAQAAVEVANRGAVEKFDKNISKDKEEISKKLSEIKTLQMKMEKDTAEYGQTSNEVKGDQQFWVNQAVLI